MFKKLFGIAPQKEPDGSFRPSKLAMKLAVPSKTDYEPMSYQKYTGQNRKIIVLFTEQKNMTMKNDVQFSTGNHPVEAILPMLHLQNAGFEFVFVTPTGRPVVFEMWAMPAQDEHVMHFYGTHKDQFENPKSLSTLIKDGLDPASYAAVFVPGGHGVMLGIPDDSNVGSLLRWAHEHDLFTITLCHGPGALLSTSLDSHPFLYEGYQMTVFPDSMDKQTPMIGYLPGHMPWMLCEKLTELGVTIINKKSDSSTCVDRRLITGASPLAANALGKLAATTLLDALEESS